DACTLSALRSSYDSSSRTRRESTSLLVEIGDDGRMLSPAHVINRGGGIARGTFLQRFGLTRFHVARAVRDGTVVRVRRGVFATDRTPPRNSSPLLLTEERSPARRRC